MAQPPVEVDAIIQAGQISGGSSNSNSRVQSPRPGQSPAARRRLDASPAARLRALYPGLGQSEAENLEEALDTPLGLSLIHI